MDELSISSSLLLEPMPKLAAALRTKREQVLERWNAEVTKLLPDADELTAKQVRNSIPGILNRMADALAATSQKPTDELMQATKNHGAVRFHEHYNMAELIAEYRILRRVLMEEMDDAYAGTVSTREWMALDTAVDIALQQAVLSFLEHQRTQLKSATEAEAKFLAFLSHDMRNILNSIMLTMQWVEQSIGKNPELREEVEGLKAAREAATSTISGMERLLQAERLRKGVAVRRDRVDLKQVSREVMAAVMLEGPKLHLEVIAPDDCWVHTDGGLVRVILHNLVGNAVKYSEKGSVKIHVEPSMTGVGAGWKLSVSDEGMGIAPEQLAKLFEAFTRGETHGQPGVGLGLFIASQAALLLRTNLQVESDVGKGSKFSLILRDLPIGSES